MNLMSATALSVGLLCGPISRAVAADPVPPALPSKPLDRNSNAVSQEKRRSKPRDPDDKARPNLSRENREEWEKRREELRQLTPEQRREKLREWRRQRLANRPDIANLSGEERQIKRREFRQRLAGEIAELRHQKQQKGLSPQEARRLSRMEEIARRFDEAPAVPSPAPPGPAVPPATRPQ